MRIGRASIEAKPAVASRDFFAPSAREPAERNRPVLTKVNAHNDEMGIINHQ
jgi:hypothetical protein